MSADNRGADDMTGKGRGMPRWRRTALPASIVLNLFLAAVIGGHLLHIRAREAGGIMPMARVLANAEAALPPQDAAAFGAVIRRDAPRYAEAAQQLGEARQELNRQFTAEKFDPQAARRALAAWSTAWDRFLGDFGNTLVTALAEVSPEGRRKLVAERRGVRGAAAP